MQGNHDKDWHSYRYGDVLISGIEFGELKDADIYSSLSLRESDFNIVILHGQITQYGVDKKVEMISFNALKKEHELLNLTKECMT